MNANGNSIKVLLYNIAANLERLDQLITLAQLGQPWGNKEQAVNNMFIALEDLKEATLAAPRPASRHIAKRKTVKRNVSKVSTHAS